jgi:predicted RNA-binding Zn-ribbon protein involved in translation (DUF1610 family)
MGSQAYKERHRKSGLCLDCSVEVFRSERCKKHYLRNIDVNRKQKRFRKKEGLCVTCGNELHEEMDANRSNCLNCRMYKPI